MAGWRQRRWMNELLVGYARVSTQQQDLTVQLNGLHALGIADDRIYVNLESKMALITMASLTVRAAGCRAARQAR
jgi:predicted site-specific integrase-resolvase